MNTLLNVKILLQYVSYEMLRLFVLINRLHNTNTNTKCLIGLISFSLEGCHHQDVLDVILIFADVILIVHYIYQSLISEAIFQSKTVCTWVLKVQIRPINTC